MIDLNNLPEPEWTHDECLQYQAARDCINGLLEFLSAWIYEEQRKSNPDQAAIECWKWQERDFVDERSSLRLKDHERIAYIRREYGAEYRRLLADPEGRSGRSLNDRVLEARAFNTVSSQP